MSDRFRIGVGLGVVAVAVVLFIALRGGGSSNSKETLNGAAVSGIPTIQLKNGKPGGGLRSRAWTTGHPVRFRVTSNIEGKVHVHGYDYLKPIKAGGSVSFDFPAKLEGVFDIELHHGG